MGSKSQVRSMQRGAHKRDRDAPSAEPDYSKIAPQIRDEDRVHIGLTEAAALKLATMLTEKVRGYARAGFRKPSEVSRLFNKEGIRTAAGAQWNPRLVYFLLGRIFGDRPRKSKVKHALTLQPLDQNTFDEVRQRTRKSPVKDASASAKSKPPRKTIKPRPPADPVPLTAGELAARAKALRDFLNN